MFPTFELFGREFGTYGILVVLGGLACGFVGAWLAKKRFGIDVFDFVLIMLILGGGIFLGAHIVYALTHLDLLIKAFQNIGSL